MMAMTTRSSMSVKPRLREVRWNRLFMSQFLLEWDGSGRKVGVPNSTSRGMASADRPAIDPFPAWASRSADDPRELCGLASLRPCASLRPRGLDLPAQLGL